MSARIWNVAGVLALAALVGLWFFALRDATRETPMPICAQAPADWQCWTPNGDVGTGTRPDSHGAYWNSHPLPRRYANATAARRTTEAEFNPSALGVDMAAAERRATRAKRAAEQRAAHLAARSR